MQQLWSAEELLRDVNLPGMAGDQIDALAQAMKFNLNIENGVLVVTPRGQPRQGGSIPLLSKDTGMIGYPGSTGHGVFVASIFNPLIRRNGLIEIQVRYSESVWTVDGDGCRAYARLQLTWRSVAHERRGRPVAGAVVSDEAAMRVPPPPPPEFLGKARAFRSRISATDDPTSQAIAQIMRPLKERFARKPIPRPEMLIAASSAWAHGIPEFGRLMVEIKLDRKKLHVDELRLSSGHLKLTHWDAGTREPGVALVRLRLDVGAKLLTANCTAVGSVSMHALARWFQRSWRQDDESLVDDLRALDDVVRQLDGMDPDGDAGISVPTTDGGA